MMKMKKLMSGVLAATMVLSVALTGCGKDGSASASKDKEKEQGKVFHIMAWNEESRDSSRSILQRNIKMVIFM